MDNRLGCGQLGLREGPLSVLVARLDSGGRRLPQVVARVRMVTLGVPVAPFTLGLCPGCRGTDHEGTACDG